MCNLLIDADLIQYRAAFACESNRYKALGKGTGEVLIEADNHKELKAKLKSLGSTLDDVDVEKVTDLKDIPTLHIIIDNMIAGIVRETGGSSWQLFLSDSECHRHKIAKAKPYKGNRGPKPTHYLEAKRYLIQKYGAVICYDLEADDLMSIVQHRGRDNGDPTVVVSYDKDLMQVPGLHYDFVKKIWKHMEVDDAKRFLYIQCGSGDGIDNIPGLPRVGDATMQKVFADADTPQKQRKAVIALYMDYEGQGKIGKPYQDFLVETANLVGILPDYGMSLNENLEWVAGPEEKMKESFDFTKEASWSLQ